MKNLECWNVMSEWRKKESKRLKIIRIQIEVVE